MGNPTQLQQVVMNLCVNAMQAMADQGSGTLELRLGQVEVLPPLRAAIHRYTRDCICSCAYVIRAVGWRRRWCGGSSIPSLLPSR